MRKPFIDTWHGVGLTTAGCVNSLNLSNNQLSGDIPTEISHLTKLEHLYLDNNQLTGRIPGWLRDIEKLEYLTLSYNQLHGCYPYRLIQLCHSLENDSDATISDGNDFYTSWSDLCNPIGIKWGICAGFSPCRERDSLALVELYHTNDGPNWSNTWDFQEPLDTWHGVRLLQQGCVGYLDLSNNQLSGDIQPEIGILRNVKFLYLNDNQLTGSIPKELRSMFYLDTLRLYNNQLSGCFPVDLHYFCRSLYMDDINIDEGNNFDVEWDVFCQNESGVCAGYEGCRESDSLSLVAIYNQTNGENWLNTWDLGQPLHQWHGVVLDENGCLVRLELNDSGLSGIIPIELGDLNELRHLDLSENQLTDSIPVEIAALNQLEYFNITHNNLGGCFDIGLFGLCNITTDVSLGNNFDTSWSNFCSYQLGLCSGSVAYRERDSLTLIQIYNQTSGENWTTTWDLHQPLDTWHGVSLNSIGYVKTLIIPDNQLTGQLPAAIGDLSELEILDLSANSLSGSIPDEIGNLFKLEQLNLAENGFVDTIPESIGNLDLLVELSLHNNQLGGAIPQSMSHLNRLVYLYLNDNQFTSMPAGIANGGLAEFNITNNQLTGCFSNAMRSAYLSAVEYYYYYGYWSGINVYWNITYGNNFDASWSDFVELGAEACGAVWPGDFNADGKVDKSDVLYWGLAEGNTGTPRDNASNSWSQQGSDNWQQSVNDINSKHQDGNGDGVIDEDDLDALIANYQKTHTFNPQNYIASGIEYRLEPLSDTIENGNVVLRYALYVEEGGTPANVHGVACSIDFGELSAGNIVIDTTGSSLQPQQQVGIFDAVENRLDLALTRTDKQNTLCDGPVVVVEAIVALKDLPSDGTFSLHVNNNGSMMEANGTVNAASGMTVYDAFSFSDTEMLVTATATHAGCGTLGEAEINITGGVAPYDIWWNTGETTYQITGLTPDKYTAIVTDAVGNEKTIEVDIQGQYIPSYDEAGNILDCDIIAARIQPELCVLLEGAYSDSTGLMSSSLLSLDVLPNRQPYHESPWNYDGTEGLDWQTDDYPTGMIDWLLVSFRTQPNADTQVGETAAILMEDGCLHFTNDYISLTQNVDSLYVVVEHRNHAAVMTPQPIALTGDVLTYDFRTNDSYRTTTSSGQKQLSDGNWAMYAGDCNQTDANGYDINGQDKDPWVSLNGTFGNYAIPDLNLDGDVNGADKVLWFMNNGISSIVPK